MFNQSSFFRFSYDFYSQPDVERHCLLLQNEYQLNVNLVLFLIWYSVHHQTLISAEQIEKLQEAIVEPDEWVQDFRRYRRELWQRIQQADVGEVLEVRRALLDTELTLESQVQKAIVRFSEQYLDVSSHLTRENTDGSLQSIELEFIASENLDNYGHLVHPNHPFRLRQIQQALITRLLDLPEEILAA